MMASGFLRPAITEPLSAKDQKVFAQVCPSVMLAHGTEVEPIYHPLWGPIRSVKTGHAMDPQTRHSGSSGGVLTAISQWLVETGRVDFVLSTQADNADPIGNVTKPSGTKEEILSAAGSRYGPSAPLAHLPTHLERGRRFAFIGKPCDVAALRRMARVDARVDDLIPFKLSFFCAGVPSRNGTLEVLRALGVSYEDVKEFRYRGEGWPGLTRALRKDGTAETMDYNSSWGSILNRHLQMRCKICADGTGEFADIACADAWYGRDGYPDFAERPGRSLIVARTTVGADLLALLENDGVIATDPLDAGEIELMQPYQASRKRAALSRLMAMRLAGRQVPRHRGLHIYELARKGPLGFQLRSFLGTLRRAVKSTLGRRG